jgi:hypothetical protein
LAFSKFGIRDDICEVPSVAVRDPGSGAFLTPGSDSVWVKNQDPDPRSGFGMNIPDHISESLETIFGLKILKPFDVHPDPGSF